MMIEVTILVGLLMLAFLVLRVPVAFAVLSAGAIGLLLLDGSGTVIGVLRQMPYQHAKSFTMTTVPMFILMAEFLSSGRFTHDLFLVANRALGKFRGGVLYAVLVGGVILGAMSGSSTASAASLARAAYPDLKRLGYPDWLSGAAVSVTGTLAILIPPSLGLIVYGVFTETSVAQLLVAGIIPGLITAVGYFATLYIICRRVLPQPMPDLDPDQPKAASGTAQAHSFWTAIPVSVLMTGVMAALYTGAVTITEAGAAGAALSLLLCLVYRRLDFNEFIAALIRATRSSAMILSIVVFSSVLATFLILSGVTQSLLGYISAQGLDRWTVLVLILLIILILGFFLDQLAILLITLPLTFPLLTGLGFDPVWLGILFAKTAEIGMVSPPFGLNVFVVSGVTKVSSTTIFRGVWPFIVSDLLVLLALILLPSMATWLPGYLFKI